MSRNEQLRKAERVKEQTQKQRMLDAIEQLGGMDVVLDRIAACESLTSIAGSLGVSRDVLGRYLNKDRRLRQALGLARESAVEVLVEEALAIGRRATRLTELAARLQEHGRVWLAARRHPARAGRRGRRMRVSDSGLADLGSGRRKDAGLRGSPEASGGADQFAVTIGAARTSQDAVLNPAGEERGRN